jgi:hypothetical protein
MCSHILRVKYLSEKNAKLMEVTNDADLRAKLADLQNKDQVTEIQVYPRHHDVVLTKKWETQMYQPAPDAATAALPRAEAQA